MGESEAQIGRSTNTQSVIEWDEDAGEKKPGLCCLQGCLAVSFVGFAFFVALPIGIVLLVFATNDDSTVLLAIGCVLVSLPVFILMIVILLCINQNKLTRLKFWKKKTIPNAQSKLKNIPKNDINSNTIGLKNVTQPKTNFTENPKDATVELSLEGNSTPMSSDDRTGPRTMNYQEIHI